MSEERGIPFSAEAEQATLGSLLIDPESIKKVRDWLRPQHYYRERNALVYEAMLHLDRQKKPIDYNLLVNRLEEMGKLGELGGPAYLTDILAATPTALYLVHYSETVVKLAEQRALIAAAGNIAQWAYDGDFDRTKVRDNAVNAITAALPHKVDSQWVSSHGAVQQALLQMDPATRTPPITTGYRGLDQMMAGGWYRGYSHVVAGRPAMGKSSLMLGSALAGAKAGVPVAFFGLEMLPRDLMARAIALETGINLIAIRTGKAMDNPEMADRIMEAADKLSKLPLMFNPYRKAEGLISSCIALKADRGLDVVFVDYLQLLVKDSRTENRNLEIGSITGGLKALAMEQDLAVVLGSQLNRDVEKQRDKRPDLSDLRDSGSIEQDQDVVIGLYREEYYTGKQPGEAEAIFLKQRQGPTGTVNLGFEAATTKFTNGRF